MTEGTKVEIAIYQEQIAKLWDAHRYLGVYEVPNAIRLIKLAIADIERHIAYLER